MATPVNYAAIKEYFLAKNTYPQYAEDESFYFLSIGDISEVYVCKISKTLPGDAANLSDFETNYKSLSNPFQNYVRNQDGAGTNLTSTTSGGKQALDVNLVNNLITVGEADKTAFIYGTSAEQPVGGVYQDTSPTLTAGTTGALRLTQNRGLHTNLRNDSGTEIATASNPVRTDPTGTTPQPATQSGTWNINNVSGTVTLPTGAATESTLAKLPLAQGSTTSGEFGVLTQGAVTTASPTYTNGQTDPLSLTTAGALRIDGSATTQPVSGTITANQGGTWNINNVSGTISLPTGAATAANQATEISSLSTIATNTSNTNTSVQNTQGSVAPGTVATKSDLVGAQYNSTPPTLTNGQQAALQVDSSGRLIISPGSETLTEDHNYGTVGANTLRTASQIGNATGAADFNAGNASAQTLRTVIATNQSAIPVSQSGSWTVTANAGTNLNTSALALDTSVNGILVSQGSTTSGEKGPLVQGAVTTAAPTYTTGQTDPLSLTTSGALRTDSSATTQPVSGTVTANQGTNPWTVQGDSASGASKAGNPVQIGGVFNTTQPTVTTGQTVEAQSTARGAQIVATGADNFNINNISGTVSLPTGAATETTLAKLPLAQSSTTSGESGVLTQGAVTTAAPTYTTGQTNPLSLTTAGALRTDGSATTQPVSAASLPLPTGAATEATLTKLPLAQASATSGQSGPLIQGAVTTAAPTYSTGQTDPLSLTTAGALRIDGSGTTQPISGTVTANQGGTWNINNISGTVSLPTGAATAANQATEITSLSSIATNTSNTNTSVQNTQGPVTPGAVATKSDLMGGQYNSTLPTLTNTQQSAIQLDSSGRLITTPTYKDVTQTGTITAINQTVAIATSGGYATTTVSTTGTWSGILIFEYSNDNGTTWWEGTVHEMNVNGIQVPLFQFAGNDAGMAEVGGWTNFRVRASTWTSGTANITLNNSVAPQPNRNWSLDATLDSVGSEQFGYWKVGLTVPTGDMDVGFGTVGIKTLRTASQMGNATGAADFNAGATGAQTLRTTSNQGTPGTAANAWFEKITDGTNTASVTASSALKVDGSAVTQPISAASLPLPTGASTEATLAKLPLAQASTTSGQSGTLVQGAVTTAAPLYTTGQTDPLSLTTAGALRVDASATTQPVSGTVTANQGTANSAANAWPHKITDGTNTAAVKAASTAATPTDQALVVAISPNNSIAATQLGNWNIGINSGSNTIGGVTQSSGPWTMNMTQVGGAFISLGQTTMANSMPVTIASNQTSLSVSGTVSVGNFPATQNVNITNASLPVTQLGNWNIGINSGSNTIGGVTQSSGPWSMNMTQVGGAFISLGQTTMSASMPVTIASNQTALAISAASLPLPTGAATETTLAKLPLAQASTTSGQSGVLIQGAVTTASPSYTTAQTSALSLTLAGALRVDASATTQPVSGTVTANQGTNPWTVQGDAASGAAKAGNPVQIGGVFNTTQPTVTTGQAVEAQSTNRGALIVSTGVDNFNINNISGTVSLPTGAATAANQTTEITSLQSIDNPVGSVAAGTAGTSSFLGGAVFNTTLPSLTNGQQAALQMDSTGHLLVSSANADGDKATYSAIINALASAATATDIFTITGSATKTIRVTRIEITAVQTLAATDVIQLIKRSAANTGGTSTSPTMVAHDSNNAAATATVRAYTANPSALGAAVGTIRANREVIPAVGGGNLQIVWDFGTRPGQALVLRGTAEVLAVSLNSTTITGGSFNISIEFTEE